MESATTNSLYAIWGQNGNDVYAVGMNGEIVHYDGATWDISGCQDTSTTPPEIATGNWGIASGLYSSGPSSCGLNYMDQFEFFDDIIM